MTEAMIARAAKAISRTLKATKGQAGPWALARAALMSVSHEADACKGERAARSVAKAKSYRERAQKAMATRKRLAAARAAANQEEAA